jgi:hypothetical protein
MMFGTEVSPSLCVHGRPSVPKRMVARKGQKPAHSTLTLWSVVRIEGAGFRQASASHPGGFSDEGMRIWPVVACILNPCDCALNSYRQREEARWTVWGALQLSGPVSCRYGATSSRHPSIMT